jgi:hypothetical protein
MDEGKRGTAVPEIQSPAWRVTGDCCLDEQNYSSSFVPWQPIVLALEFGPVFAPTSCCEELLGLVARRRARAARTGLPYSAVKA